VGKWKLRKGSKDRLKVKKAEVPKFRRSNIERMLSDFEQGIAWRLKRSNAVSRKGKTAFLISISTPHTKNA
jgi:hypothetical protein